MSYPSKMFHTIHKGTLLHFNSGDHADINLCMYVCMLGVECVNKHVGPYVNKNNCKQQIIVGTRYNLYIRTYVHSYIRTYVQIILVKRCKYLETMLSYIRM